MSRIYNDTMKHLNIISLLAIIIFLSACSSSRRKDQTINISGAFALYPLVIQWAEEYKKDHPDIRFNISAGGAGKGMADALSGTVDLGMFSRQISQEEINRGVWWVGLSIDAVLPTISAKNQYLDILKKRGLSREEFRQIFIDGTITDWSELLGSGERKSIVVYIRSDACGAAGTWAEYLDGTQEDLIGIGIFGDPGLAEAVAVDPTGIGFNNTVFVYDIKSGRKNPAMEVIPIDINSNKRIDPEEDFYNTFESILNAVAEGKYPSPPARELYFVANGKPTKASTLDFIEWVLTKGQRYVTEAGYVPIEPSRLEAYLAKIK
ncbi:MAG TPA: substrate-binding domain-containing protein [Bacteroidales bacterium]|nr:substrate-binding domain-containing protein [Bacteroidales bacterium]